MTSVRVAYLGLGSNLGDRLAHLQDAIDGLAATEGIEVIRVSQVYATDPVGGPEQGEYLNAAVAVTTNLDARELLATAKRLEAEAQRVATERWGPRTLDIDVLIVGDEKWDLPDLQVPHPRIFERGFVLAPLGDLGWKLSGPAPADWPGVRRTDLSLRVP